MAKPRIIILMHYMEIGGAEISLVGLLGALNPELVDVDLFVYDHRGPLMRFIPEWVNLLPERKSYSMYERTIKEAILRGQIGVAAGRLIAKIRHRNYVKKARPEVELDASIFQYIGDSVSPFMPKINPKTEYDLCISFLNPHNFGLDKVRAKRRLAWIHTDYSTISVNINQELKVWSRYDYIASISPHVTETFLKIFPSLSKKIIEVENILSPKFVRERANEETINYGCEGVKLLSVGRFTYAKNYDNVPDIARRMVEKGLKNLKWYIIGYGGDEPLIRRKIEEAGMTEHVIILGKKDNPYPYIKACDIYVQPSRYEGKSVTVREAQMLGKPVAVTAYPTASSQIRDGVDGVIVPMDNEGCAQSLTKFIANERHRKAIEENLTRLDFGNEEEVKKLYEMI